jgi:fructokinase
MAASYMVKMNEDEFLKITAWYGFDGRRREEAGRQLSQRFKIGVLVVTLGAGGGWLLSGGEFVEHPGFAVKVVDTVGAGDAFFAAFINGFMAKQPWAECLSAANLLGSKVASRPGATAL